MLIKGFRGFLFIGDPHLASYRPGKRMDDYQNAILNKLKQAAQISCDENLVPIILGDLFHNSNENSLTLLSRLTDIARTFPLTPETLEGNHDKEETRLTEKDALSYMHKTRVVSVITKSGLVAEYDFEGQRVRLYATPFGADIPSELPEEDGVLNIMITHHDLNFSGAHVGCKPLSEIKGCHMLVNGHLHKTLPSFNCGMTRAHNPGNIARLSVDVRDHVPAVWEWLPSFGDFELKKHPLQHVQDVFDLTGDQVAPAKSKAAVKALERSYFAELLSTNDASKMEGIKSDDATGIREELKEVFEELHTSDAARLVFDTMMKELKKGAKLKGSMSAE